LITVIYDTADPLITITDPTPNLNYLTNVQPVLLGGTTSDDLGVTQITWTSSAGGGGSIGPPYNAWSKSIPLTAGPNLITVTAQDAAGRTGIARIQIVYDPTAPDLAIVQPTSASAFKSTTSPLTLAGTAFDNVGIDSVTWKNTSTGLTGTATGGTGAWTITGIGLIEGDNVINVTAADTVGNTKTVAVTVSYDGTPPTVDITIPVATGTYGPTSVRPLTIGGNAADNLELTSVTWVNSKGGSGTAWSGSSTAVAWSASVYLYSGDNIITVTATDGHGYSTVAIITVNFLLEGEAPESRSRLPRRPGRQPPRIRS
jgi:hypothetical protein